METDPETDALLTLCHEMVFFTRNVFDPTALPLIRLWNWKATPPVVPDASTVAAKPELVGWYKVQRRKGGIFLPVQVCASILAASARNMPWTGF